MSQGVILHLNEQELNEISVRIDAAIRAGGSQAAYALIPIEQKLRQAVEQSQAQAKTKGD